MNVKRVTEYDAITLLEKISILAWVKAHSYGALAFYSVTEKHFKQLHYEENKIG